MLSISQICIFTSHVCLNFAQAELLCMCVLRHTQGTLAVGRSFSYSNVLAWNACAWGAVSIQLDKWDLGYTAQVQGPSSLHEGCLPVFGLMVIL